MQTAVSRGLPHRILRSVLRDKWLWMFASVGIAWYVIFAYMPMYGVIIAFKEFSPFRGMAGSPWVGLQHFREFFSSQFFWPLLRNTILLNVYSLLWGFPAPIILAILLHECNLHIFKRVAQTISYLPHFISIVVIVGLLVNFTSSNGLFNVLIRTFGGDTIQFLIKPEWFRTLYVGSGIWQTMGFSSIIYLAALTGVDQEMYEAAVVDGASKVRQIWHISMPSILPTVVILLILNLGRMLTVGFEKIILMYSPSVYETADVISTFVYRRGIENRQYSYSSAVGLFQSIINLIFLVTANAISRKVTSSSLW